MARSIPHEILTAVGCVYTKANVHGMAKGGSHYHVAAVSHLMPHRGATASVQHHLSRDTLRFYEKRGLLRARRSANGYRDYQPEAVDWLRYLPLAQSLGFTLAEIEADLPLLNAPDASSGQLRVALERKLADVDQRIDGLQSLRGELTRRLGQHMAPCPLQAGDRDKPARASSFWPTRFA